jgi:hypothetical protein
MISKEEKAHVWELVNNGPQSNEDWQHIRAYVKHFNQEPQLPQDVKCDFEWLSNYAKDSTVNYIMNNADVNGIKKVISSLRTAFENLNAYKEERNYYWNKTQEQQQRIKELEENVYHATNNIKITESIADRQAKQLNAIREKLSRYFYLNNLGFDNRNCDEDDEWNTLELELKEVLDK